MRPHANLTSLDSSLTHAILIWQSPSLQGLITFDKALQGCMRFYPHFAHSSSERHVLTNATRDVHKQDRMHVKLHMHMHSRFSVQDSLASFSLNEPVRSLGILRHARILCHVGFVSGFLLECNERKHVACGRSSDRDAWPHCSFGLARTKHRCIGGR